MNVIIENHCGGSKPANHGMDDLTAALESQGITALQSNDQGNHVTIVCGLSHEKRVTDLAKRSVALIPDHSEGYCIEWLTEDGREVVLIASDGERGLECMACVKWQTG